MFSMQMPRTRHTAHPFPGFGDATAGQEAGMHPDTAGAPPTRLELDQYLRELRRLSPSRRMPEAFPGAPAPRLGLSRHELRVLRRAAGEKRTR